jgi:acylphosphatase
MKGRVSVPRCLLADRTILPASSHERRQVIYHGRVQGVGFRYTCRHIAQSHAVTGFVKNLEDGSVQLVAEGSPEALDRYLSAIAERMGPNIRRADITSSPPTGQFSTFDIAY